MSLGPLPCNPVECLPGSNRPDVRRVRRSAVDQTRRPPERSETQEWRPGGTHLLTLFALILAGAFVGAVLLGDPRRAEASANSALLWASLVIAAAWLVALPLSQWLLLRRVGARPRVGCSNFPAPFGLLRSPGQRLSRWAFSLACALPACFAFVVLPVLAVLLPGSSGAGVLVGVAGGLPVYQLCYALLALSSPRGTLVEELAGEEGAVRFHRASGRPANRSCARR